MRALILILSLTIGTAGFAAPLDFQAWKEQQVLSSQNQVLRLSAQLNQIKTGRTQPLDDKSVKPSVMSSRIKKTGGDPLILAENNLTRAKESLQTANNLTVDDYITIYLPSLQSHPEDLDQLASTLNKDQLATLFRSLVKRLGSDQVNASRQAPSGFEGMALSN